MAEYINIRGQSIEVVASDPANPTLGQIWYNSTSNTLKGLGVSSVGSWATGNNLNTAREGLGGAGTQTAALAFAGYTTPASPTGSALTEEYDGTSWVNSNLMNTARYSLAGSKLGTQTAVVGFGGFTTVRTGATEEYDGTSWTTSPGTLNTARDGIGGTGIQTAALALAGVVPPYTTATEEYDGSSWTTSGSMNTARGYLGSAGTQTAGLAVGGYAPPGVQNATEEYNGATWTSSNPLIIQKTGLTCAGTQTAGLAAGGGDGPGYTTSTELYDGTSWTSNPTGMNTGRQNMAGTGSQTFALAFGGQGPTPARQAATEEWTGAGAPLTVTITAS